MQVQVQAFQLQDAESFRNSAFMRAHFALRRAVQEVIQARIQLRDVNGPRGGIDQQCRVTLVTHTRGVLVATSRARNAGAALAQALRMAVQSLARVWQRKRRPDRKSIRVVMDSFDTDASQEAPVGLPGPGLGKSPE